MSKLLFTKMYLKYFKKILKKHIVTTYENQLNNYYNRLSNFIIF